MSIWYIILAALVVLVAVVAFLYNNQGGSTSAERLPYEQKDLLSVGERSFYEVLCTMLEHQAPGQYAVFAKVRLGDLLKVPRVEGAQGFRNKVNQKHADFVVCNRTTLATVAVIELDDRSHEREDRQERDAFVEQALGAAGIPIAHIPAKRAYALADIHAEVAAALDR